jgi:uncharacterized protein YndB with AHSA1/START domain
MDHNKIKVHTIVAAEINKVWDYWTLPQHIINWNFASENWLCPSAENDLRVGGKFNYRMASLDNDEGFDFEGTYDEIIKHHKISYTLADKRHVDVRFESVENSTSVTELFDPENVNPADMQQAGWQAILDNFKKYVEQMENPITII